MTRCSPVLSLFCNTSVYKLNDDTAIHFFPFLVSPLSLLWDFCSGLCSTNHRSSGILRVT